MCRTTLKLGSENTNILASGGIRGEIRMFHPANKVCFHEWKPVEKKNTAVNSLVFHTRFVTGGGDMKSYCYVVVSQPGFSVEQMMELSPCGMWGSPPSPPMTG